jgi:hypothetical protein
MAKQEIAGSKMIIDYPTGGGYQLLVRGLAKRNQLFKVQSLAPIFSKAVPIWGRLLG